MGVFRIVFLLVTLGIVLFFLLEMLHMEWLSSTIAFVIPLIIGAIVLPSKLGNHDWT
jgi:hypothetical protein